MKGQQSSVICDKQSVNTICFTIDVEGTDLVDSLMLTTKLQKTKQNPKKNKRKSLREDILQCVTNMLHTLVTKKTTK